MRKVTVMKTFIRIMLCGLLGLTLGCGVGMQNDRNIKKIKKGMTKKQVIDIMGSPRELWQSPDAATFSYVYDAPFASSDNFYVFFDKKDTLVPEICYAQ